MRDGVLAAAGAGGVAAELVLQRRVVRVVLEALGRDRVGALVVLRAVGRLGEVPVLERRRRPRRARLAADHEDRGLLRGRRRGAALLGAGEDERPGGRVDRLAVELERRVAGHDDVELLVMAGAVALLVVVLDDLVAGVRARVGVDAERRHPHRPPDRAIDEIAHVDPSRARRGSVRREVGPPASPIHGTRSRRRAWPIPRPASGRCRARRAPRSTASAAGSTPATRAPRARAAAAAR